MTMTINGSGTITGLTAGGLPDASVTQPDLAAGVAGNGPAFSAYQNSGQSVTSSVYTKAQFQAKEFDTNSNYDNTTNYRFTPTVAGYYQINSGISTAGTASQIIIAIYKNGSAYKGVSITTTNGGASTSSIVYCNGTTDYIEIYVYIVGTSPATFASQTFTYFQASMVRSA